MFLHPLALALLWTTFKEEPTATPAAA
jgi:hypothetical protein